MRILFLILFLFTAGNFCVAQEIAPEMFASKLNGNGFKEFTCYSNYFKVLVPVDWELYEDIMFADTEKVYGMDVKGPANKDGAFTSITVLYYGPDHAMFKSPEDFIKANSGVKSNRPEEKFEPVTETEISGRKASRIERHVFLTLPFKEESVPMRELLFVIPSEKGGFFMLEYSSAEDVFQKYNEVFDLMLASFKPSN